MRVDFYGVCLLSLFDQRESLHVRRISILAVVFAIVGSHITAFALDFNNDEDRKRFGRSTWVTKIARDFRCASLVGSRKNPQVYDFYLEGIETKKRLMGSEWIGYSKSEIDSIVKDGKRQARWPSKDLFNKDWCLKTYDLAKEMDREKLRDGTPGNCILAPRNHEMSKAILEGSTNHKVVDGFTMFELPEGYTTDTGTIAHLKNEVMVYRVGGIDDRKVFLSEVEGKIHVREQYDIIIGGKSACAESGYYLLPPSKTDTPANGRQ